MTPLMTVLGRRRWGVESGLCDFCYSTAHSLVLVTDYALDAISIEALVDPVSIGEEFTHDHWFLTAYASEGSRPSFVNKKSKVYLSTIRLLLEILSIRKR